MKKIALGLMMTDTHLNESNIELNKSLYHQAIDICQERDLTHIFHLGDVFDSRKAQSLQILNSFSDILDNIADCGIIFHVTPGNHDKTDYSSKESFLDVFKYHRCVKLYDTGGVITGALWDGARVYMMPYFNEKDGSYVNYFKSFTELAYPSNLNTNILLTHIGVTGAKMNSGEEVTGVSVDLFKYLFNKVYIGHYHDYQELNNGQIVYTGSTHQHNFGENNHKGFNILYNDGSIEFIKAEFTEYKKIVIDLSKVTKDELKQLKKENSSSSNKVRFIFKGNKEMLSKIDKSEFASIGIDIKTEENDIEIIDYEDAPIVSFTKESLKEEWKEFTKEDEIKQNLGLNYFKN